MAMVREDHKPNTSLSATALAVVAILVILAALYVGGYFVLCDEYFAPLGPQMAERHYCSEWIAAAYRPLAMVESWLTGNDIKAVPSLRR